MKNRFAVIAGLAAWPLCFLAAANGMPALHGSAAVTYLQREGVYNSLNEAVQAAMYGARPDGLGYAAPISRQHFVARFSEGGLRIDGVGWHTSWELRSIGYGERQTSVRLARLEANGTRMDLRRGASVTEWYVNDAHGLEQGFTLQRPAGERRIGERLRLMMAVSGDLKARDALDGVELVRPDGTVALRYEHLVVKDAQGRELAARMQVTEGMVSVEVEDGGAAWPLTVDPTFVQQAYFDLSGRVFGSGPTLSVSGDTVVVGVYLDSSNASGVNGDQSNISAPDSGAAFVFVRIGNTWTQQAYLKASNPESGDWFGGSVAVSGDTVVIGAPGEDSSATGVNGDQSNNSSSLSGAVYVFVRSGVTWSQQAYLKASNTHAEDFFGSKVAVSGDIVVVGAPHERGSAAGVNGYQGIGFFPGGAAYVFVRNGAAWSQQAYLKASNNGGLKPGGIPDNFCEVAVSGDTIVVGAFGEDSSSTGVNGDQTNYTASNAGAAYVFVRNGVTWSQQAYLKASNTAADAWFGSSVAVSGDTIVVGAPFADTNGVAYVFVRNGITWTQQAYVQVPNPVGYGSFGAAVGLSGDTAVSLALQESEFGAPVGNAYVFTRNGETWSKPYALKAAKSGMGVWFGGTTAVSGDTVMFWKYSEESFAAGSVFVFGPGSTCSQTLSSASQSMAVVGGLGTVGVTAPAGCDWTAVSNAIWLTVNSGFTGTSNGTVTFLAASNLGTEARFGTLTIGEQTFTVFQAGTSTCIYTLDPRSGIGVPAAGGSGFAVTMTTQASCAWSATSNSSWLTFTTGSSGSGSGVVQYSALANLGTQKAGTITIGGQAFAVTQVGATVFPTPDNALLLSQFVGGGPEWHTTLFLTNLSASPEDFTMRFYNDAGLPAAMPMDTVGIVSAITGTLAPGQTRLYETGADPDLHGAWALLTPATLGTSRLAGFAVFRHTVPNSDSVLSSEAAVDLIGGTETKYVLLYDNFAGPVTAAAFSNPDALNAVTILADIRDEQGNQIATDSITLPPLGHTAFVLTDRFPATIARRGSIRFTGSPKGFGGLGLRFSPFGTFTSFRLLTSKDIQ